MKILVVDDDKRLANIIKEVFEYNGFKVVTSNDGEDAINKINVENNFDLVITDIKMPKKSGFEMVKELREEGNLIPVIFLTGNSNIITKERAIQSGVNEYITKPIDFSELIERIKEYEK